MQFKALHEMFEEQYTALWESTDEIAERIRALDAYAPTTFAGLIDQADLKEEAKVLKAEAMVKSLADDREKIVKATYPVLRDAEDAGDEATVDMLIELIDAHEMAAWMLKSTAK